MTRSKGTDNKIPMKWVFSTPSAQELGQTSNASASKKKKQKSRATTDLPTINRTVASGSTSAAVPMRPRNPTLLASNSNEDIYPLRRRIVRLDANHSDEDAQEIGTEGRAIGAGGNRLGHRALGREMVVLAPPERADGVETEVERAEAEYLAAHQTARDELVAHLSADPMLHDSHRQNELEAKFIAHNTTVHARRKQVFGDGYRLGQNMGSFSASGLMTATYSGTRQTLSSASRSPVRNAVATKFAPTTNADGVQQGEFNNSLDPAAIGGAVGGATAWLVDTHLLTAMDREARARNLPVFKPVDPRILAPDPGPVGLRYVEVDGERHKQYYAITSEPDKRKRMADRADNATTGNRTNMETAAKNQQMSILLSQRQLEAKELSMLLQPLMTGSTNATRRYLASAYELLTPHIVFFESMAASGLAGGATRFGLDMLKMMPSVSQVTVDDLVGGKQTLNLFVSEGIDPSQRAAQWSDIGHLPSAILHTAKDTGDLLVESAQLSWESVRDGVKNAGGNLMDAGRNITDIGRLRGWEVLKAPLNLLKFGGNATLAAGNLADGVLPRDLLFRAVLGNLAASTISPNFGPYIAQVAREGSLVPLPNEALNSPANVLQQFSVSAMNDLAWQLRELLPTLKTDVGESLDRRRDAALEDLRKQDLDTRDALEDALRNEMTGLVGVRDTLTEMNAGGGMGQGNAADLRARATTLRGTHFPTTLGDVPGKLDDIARLVDQQGSVRNPLATMNSTGRMAQGTPAELRGRATALRATHFPAALGDVPGKLEQIAGLMDQHASALPPQQAAAAQLVRDAQGELQTLVTDTTDRADQAVLTAQGELQTLVTDMVNLPDQAVLLQSLLHIDTLDLASIQNTRRQLNEADPAFPPALLGPVLAQLQEISDLLESHDKMQALRDGHWKPATVDAALV